MHFLVTGGAGFIGSHLTEALLKQGHQVTVFDDFNDYYDPVIKRGNLAHVISDIQLVEADIRDAVTVERTFARNQFDAVVHLAARAGVRPSIVDPKLYFTTNIDGTFNLLDACRYHGVNHFVLASSSSVYGVNKKVLKTTSSSGRSPLTLPLSFPVSRSARTMQTCLTSAVPACDSSRFTARASGLT